MLKQVMHIIITVHYRRTLKVSDLENDTSLTKWWNICLYYWEMPWPVYSFLITHSVMLLLNPLTTVLVIWELTLGSISSLLPAYCGHNSASLSVMPMWLLAYCTFSFMIERCGNVDTVLLLVKSKTLIRVFWNVTLCSFGCIVPVTVPSCTKIV
jgi:hypothetical protein